VVPHELTADEIARVDWRGYLDAEATVLEQVRARSRGAWT